MNKPLMLVIGFLLMSSMAFAANDPGHDALYVLLTGDSNLTGSLNITDTLNASYIRAATLLYGDQLDIRANGTILSVSSRPAIQADSNDLYLDATGNVLMATRGGTTGVIQMGPTSGSAITLNVSGTILQQNVNVCLQDGTNCPAGANETGNVTGSGSTNTVAKWVSGTALGDSIIVDDGNVSVDSGTLFVDAANNNVGIGTTTPQDTLHVEGQGETLLRLNSTNTTSSGRNLLVLENFGATRISINNTNTNVTWIINNAGSEELRITDVDSGAAVTEFALTTDGNLTVTGTIAESSGAVCTAANGLCSGGGGSGGGWANTSNLVYLSSNTTNVSAGNTTGSVPLFFIDSTNERIGIGTTTPDAPLDVEANLSSSAAFMITNTYNGSTGQGIDFKRNMQPTEGNAISGINWYAYDNISEDTHYAQIYARTQHTANGSENGSLHFRARTSGAISTDDMVIREGKVGIGTTNPDVILHLRAATAQVAFNDTDTNSEWYAGIDSTGEDFLVSKFGSGDTETTLNETGVWEVKSGGDFCITGGTCLSTVSGSAGGWTDSGDQVALTTATDNVSIGSTPTLFVDNTNGFVGIGTGTPSSQLTLFQETLGTSQLQFTNGSLNYSQYIDGNGDLIITVTGTGGAEFEVEQDADVRVGGGGQTLLFLDNSSGNVGINTTSPEAVLHVSGGVGSYLLLDNGVILGSKNSSGGIENLISHWTDDIVYVDNRHGDISLRAGLGALTSRLYINASNGNVGIGTTNPTHKLDIVSSSADHLKINSTSDSTDAVIELHSGSKQWQISQKNSDDFFAIMENGVSHRLIIEEGTGEVGIGITDPGDRLDIGNGDFRLDAGQEIFFEGSGVGQIRTADDNHRIIMNQTGNVMDFREWGIFRFRGGSRSTSTGFAMQIEGCSDCEDATRVGINTTSPGGIFHIAPAGGSFIVTDSGDVGIGTTNPSSLLHVNGSGASIQVIDSAQGDVGWTLNYATISNPRVIAYLNPAVNGTQDFNIGHPTGQHWDDVRVNMNRTFEVNSPNSNTRFIVRASDGDVGIGTTNPAEPLHVERSDAARTSIKVRNTNAAAQNTDIILNNSASEWAVRNSVAGDLYFQETSDGGVEMALDVNGNLGIGTTTPSQDLDVESSAARLELNSTGNNAAVDFFANNGRNWLLGLTTTLNQFNIRDQSSTTNIVQIVGGTNTVLHVNGTSDRVGVGTTGPGSTMEIVGNLTINGNNDNSKIFFHSPGDTGWTLGREATPTNAQIVTAGAHVMTVSATANQGFMIRASDGASLFEMQGNNGMTFINGSVGIGTVTPTQKLHVENGGIVITRSSNDPFILFNRSSSNVGQIRANTQSTIDITNDVGSTEYLTVNTSSGNVGIGTNAPADPLHVITDSGGQALHLEENSGGEDWQIGVDSGGNLDFYNSGGTTEAITIRDVADTVGIGTNNPGDGVRLNVRSNGTAMAGIASVLENAPGPADWIAIQINANNNTDDINNYITWEWNSIAPTSGPAISGIRTSVSEADLAFFVTAADARYEIMRLDGSANTTTIKSPLTVGGALTIVGNCADGDGGDGGPDQCDGVFHPDYPLESLEEHAKYMWENSYLRGVGPTPVDEPWNLGKKSAGILNELEKAHIYIEQLHQRIEALEKAYAESKQEKD